MPKSHKGALSHYVGHIMREKYLSRRDVKLRSDGQITDSYVSGIVNGTATNLSIEKLKALARGLRVTERELVEVAYGLSDAYGAETENGQSHNFVVFGPEKPDHHRRRHRRDRSGAFEASSSCSNNRAPLC